ncbi:Variant surface glycoprotein [Trypanosoma congolense IL3000]|uniref:Variant surface glycoprotein n=1 Tax=Trypanosoma congolense (strain IL3000) TaxID=1068625 RepID=F9WK82_TRYCI|nr:Variant surface glycoprotein [Trypanosoma congolense IL3000]
MLMKFALVVLVSCAGVVCGQHPSAAEFNLFCRILAEANNMMYGPDYIYDENADREIVKEMTVLYNATTDNMNEFRKTLWVTKDFFEAHPPPTQSENRKKAHREIRNLIKDGEEKIQENKKIALEVNEEINKAKLSVAHGLYGDHVTVLPKDYANITKILNNTKSIFNSDSNVKEGCGSGEKNKAGKTLINDLFCVCAGEGMEAERPCHPKIWPPKSWSSNNGNGKWTLIKFSTENPPQLVQSFSESFQKIEHVCRGEMMKKSVKTKNMPALLQEYVGMIMGWDSWQSQCQKEKIFGHSERKKKEQVTKCTGEAGSHAYDGPEKKNENICVDYSNHFNNGKYEIPWHEKFKNYTTLMKSAKDLEEKILKNRAALLILKSQAWVAYCREKDDETSNLDDMNVSHLFDATQLPPSFPSFAFPFLFLFS